MKISEKKEAYLREQVREIVALNPMVSIRGIQGLMEHNTGRSISDKYVTRLLHKVRREAVVQADRTKLSSRLIEIRERNIALRNQLYRIAYWTPRDFQYHGIRRPRDSDRISAIKAIAQLDLALLKAELDMGAYEDHHLTLTRRRLIALEEETVEVQTICRWNL